MQVRFTDFPSKLLPQEVAGLMDARFVNDDSLVRRIMEVSCLLAPPSRVFLGGSQTIEYSLATGAPKGLSVVDVTTENYKQLLVKLLSDTEYRLAPGFYELESPLALPSRVLIRGAASGRTVLCGRHLKPTLVVEGAENVTVDALALVGCKGTALRTQEASNILLSNLFIDTPDGYGVQIDDGSCGVSLINSHIRSTRYGGVMARGLIDNLLISDNIVDGAYRGELEISNYGAAIRIQALEHLRQEFDNAVTLPSCRPSSQCLLFNGVFSHYIGARRPRNVGVTRNKVTNSRSQGIYLSGSTLTHIVDNIISQCDKEALCIDHQSSLNVVSQNIITCTGQRDRQSTRELINDHIDIAEQDAQFVKAKLPAVSIDYSDMNLIWNNSIAGNSGGGIKAVRLACFNVIGCNSLSGNNSGDNDTHVFPEILLGDASVEGTAKRTYRHSFDNRGYGSSANFLVANKITANKRAVQINKSSALNVVAKNQVFGCRDFDFRVANDTSYTVDPSGTLIRLPSGSWPPSKALIL